jgi:hypothetical protein
MKNDVNPPRKTTFQKRLIEISRREHPATAGTGGKELFASRGLASNHNVRAVAVKARVGVALASQFRDNLMMLRPMKPEQAPYIFVLYFVHR